MEVLLKLMTDYGIPLGLVIFFIWRDFLREKTMAKRISMLDDEIKAILKDLVAKTTMVIMSNNSLIQTLIKTLDAKPCIAEDLARRILSERLEKNTENNC